MHHMKLHAWEISLLFSVPNCDPIVGITDAVQVGHGDMFYVHKAGTMVLNHLVWQASHSFRVIVSVLVNYYPAMFM